MKFLLIGILALACQKTEVIKPKWKLFAIREKMTETALPDTLNYSTHSVEMDTEDACRKNSTEFLYYQNHGEERPDFQYKTAICAFNCKLPAGIKEGHSLKEYACQKVIAL